jgi:hypothetical protein
MTHHIVNTHRHTIQYPLMNTNLICNRWSVTISDLEPEVESAQEIASPAAVAITATQRATERNQTQRKKRGSSSGKENSTGESDLSDFKEKAGSDCSAPAVRGADKECPDKKKKRRSNGGVGQLAEATAEAVLKSIGDIPVTAPVSVSVSAPVVGGKRGQRGARTDVLASLK